MTTPATPSYAGYRFPAEVISHAVWGVVQNLPFLGYTRRTETAGL